MPGESDLVDPADADFMGMLDKHLNNETGKIIEPDPTQQQQPTQKPADKPANEEVDDTEEDDDDLTPVFNRGKDKKKEEEPDKDQDKDQDPKNGRDTSIANLRKKYDAKEKEFNTLKTETESLTPLLDWFKERANGVVNKDTIQQFVEDLNNKEKEIQDLRDELDKTETNLKTINIRESKEFKDKYHRPYVDAAQEMLASFATIGPDRKVIGVQAAKAFHDFLMTGPNAADVKAEYRTYAAKFKQETGEDPEPLNISSLMGSVRSFVSAKEKIDNVVADWDANKKREAETETLESAKRSKDLARLQKKQRVDLVSKAYLDFDFDKVKGFINDDEIKQAFDEEFKSSENIFSGDPSKIPSYDVLYARGVKALLWDKHIDKIMEAIKYLNEKQDSDRPSGGRRFTPKGEENKALDIDWADPTQFDPKTVV